MNEEVVECITFGEWFNGGRNRSSKYIPTPISWYKEESERQEKRQAARKLLEELKKQHPVLGAL